MDILKKLSAIIEEKNTKIEDWFQTKFHSFQPLLYTSVDLRNSGYKIAPVDANFFPAGFNNFSIASQDIAAKNARQYIDQYYPNNNKILIIPENHTRNKKYIDNLLVLKEIFTKAKFEVTVGSYDIISPMQITAHSGKVLDFTAINQKDTIINTSSGFAAELIVLNNDMTSGIPEILQHAYQPIIPSPKLGWFHRIKSKYFTIYQDVVEEFSSFIDIDPWLLSAMTDECQNISFSNNESIEKIAVKTEEMIKKIRQKYFEYSIKDEPYVFIKAEKGTYGMGIMVARGADEIINMNKKIRNKMNKIKHQTEVNSVIIQEGIPTVDIFTNTAAEPLIYYIGSSPVCSLYRYNDQKDKFSNLNSLGCSFADVTAQPNKPWHLVSKLAALAAAIEAKQSSQKSFR